MAVEKPDSIDISENRIPIKRLTAVIMRTIAVIIINTAAVPSIENIVYCRIFR